MRHSWVVRKVSGIGQYGIQSSLTSVRSGISPPVSMLSHADMSGLLSSSRRWGFIQLPLSVHASLIKNPRAPSCNDAILVWNSLISSYSYWGALHDAVKLFDDMPAKDTVSWNAIISGVMNGGKTYAGFEYFKLMLEIGSCDIDKATLTTVLASSRNPSIVHSLVVKFGFDGIVAVENALITSYLKCGSCQEAKRVFDEMPDRNVISWTAIISGLTQEGMCKDSLNLFAEMKSGAIPPNSFTFATTLAACSLLKAVQTGRQVHAQLWKMGFQEGLCVKSALMDMYSKCGSMEETWMIFHSAELLDEVSLTIILVNLANNGLKQESLQVFLRLMKEGFETDATMISTILGVIGRENSIDLSKQIHSLAIKNHLTRNIFVNNGLINAYSRTGNRTDALKVFSKMPQRNPVSWNSIIATYARHGDGGKALNLFDEMRRSGCEPTDVTFLSLLHGCSHAGLVEKGMALFELMVKEYKMKPRIEHYATVVDMLGRVGMIEEARRFIEGLDDEYKVEHVWQSLLGACGKHEDNEVGKPTAERLMAASPNRAEGYVALGNLLCLEGKWKEKSETLGKMREFGLVRDQGMSWVDLGRL